ncbi:MAG: hypothetical protein ACR2RA_14585 [Geminicoccaceae bacterium]
MARDVRTIVIGTLALLAFTVPAFGQDKAPPRTPWEKVEPKPGQTVRWVVEGCAAYPVVVDADRSGPAPAADPEAGADIAVDMAGSIDRR